MSSGVNYRHRSQSLRSNVGLLLNNIRKGQSRGISPDSHLRSWIITLGFSRARNDRNGLVRYFSPLRSSRTSPGMTALALLP